MRVLVLGQTGIEKGRFLTALVASARRNRGLPEDDRDRYASGFVRAIHLEEEIKEHTHNATIQPYLDNLDADPRLRTWQEVMKREVLAPLETAPPEHVFLAMHGLFYRNNNFFTPVDWPLLQAFRPTVVLTLIDDAYDVASRVTVVRETQGPRTQSSITVAEALLWRSAEVSMADMISRSLGISNFVLSVKHPSEAAFRMLFRRDILRIYASFPISSTRRIAERVKEINTHRERLHREYAVFDPVCIDELRVIRPAEEGASWEFLPRWPLGPVGSAVPSNGDYAAPLQPQLQNLADVITSQIEERDYRFIDQADVVVAYRPFWGAIEYPAQGVEKEISHAIAKNKAVYYYDPPEDFAGRKSRAFRVIERGIRFETLEKLYAELAKVQKRRNDEAGDRNTTFEAPP